MEKIKVIKKQINICHQIERFDYEHSAILGKMLTLYGNNHEVIHAKHLFAKIGRAAGCLSGERS